MVSKKKVTISWSGGKDASLALYKILLAGEYEVVHLHTVFNANNKRVGLHGVHEALIEKQTQAIGLPLVKLYLDESETHASYEAVMARFYKDCFFEGIQAVVFGDIFLEDLRDYRLQLLKPAHLEAIFPIWKIDSKKLLEDFLNVGFQTLICSANAEHFHAGQLGKALTHNFMNSLKPEVDACGENGEFHTFVFDGPIFKNRVAFSLGDVTSKSYHYKVTANDGSIEDQETAFWFQELAIPL